MSLGYYSHNSKHKVINLFSFKLLHTSFYYVVFFFNDTATTEIYTLSLHDALPICRNEKWAVKEAGALPQQELVSIKSVGAAATRNRQ